MRGLLFHTKDFGIIWHNDSIMGSDEQDISPCDAIKQPGEKVTVG